jgi:hypothetical protein
MKRAVSISLGSSKRNKAVEVNLLGQQISIERIGTDGDMEKAARLYQELDGKVDAFGVGGADLGLLVADKWYPLYSVRPMVRFVEKTPIVDGTGLKVTLEGRVPAYLDKHLGSYIEMHGGKKALVASGADRWGMTRALVDAGYECVFGDLMFGLGIPIPLRTPKALKTMAALAMPIAGRLPFSWVYPTGEKQEVRVPKFEKYYRWATLISGDRHYIVRHMPGRLEGKVVATNTTTEADIDLLKSVGIKYLVTATPVIEGRSFGTNMMEAALIAVAGNGKKLTYPEIDRLLDELGFEPKIMELN